MSEATGAPHLKRILGTLVFGAGRPLTPKELRVCLREVAEEHGGDAQVFASVRERDIVAALEELAGDLQRFGAGFHLAEVAGGYRLQSDAECGLWLRQLLKSGKPNRLSRPALETLAIIAYRQPITRGEIEGIRGVAVDHVIKALMETQLVRIAGRSELPGRPFMYGTTQTFLEHFGLRNLDELADLEPMLLHGGGGAAASSAGSSAETDEAGQKAETPADKNLELPLDGDGEDTESEDEDEEDADSEELTEEEPREESEETTDQEMNP